MRWFQLCARFIPPGTGWKESDLEHNYEYNKLNRSVRGLHVQKGQFLEATVTTRCLIRSGERQGRRKFLFCKYGIIIFEEVEVGFCNGTGKGRYD